MTISANNFTFDHVPGVEKSVTVHFHTTDPGVFAVDYPTGITGPPTVRTPEEWERAWRNMGSGGDYLARIGAEGNGRSNVTFLFTIDWTKLQSASAITQFVHNNTMLAASFNMAMDRRINWALSARKYGNGAAYKYTQIFYGQSASSVVVELAYVAASDYLGNIANSTTRYAITLTSGDAGDVAVNFYKGSPRGAVVSGTRNSTGTMGGTEALIWQQGIRCAKIQHVCDNAELDAWFSDGTIPATDREFVFSGGQEINSASPVIYDTSGNVTPLDLTATQITNWQAPGMRGDFTDTGFTSPLVEVPITVAADCAAGTHNITLRRNRVGIPVRVPPLSDAELYDDGTLPVTVVDLPLTGAVGPVITARVKL